MKAPEILNRASDIMDERAKQYDSPQGERSMGKAVAAFNAITGHKLTEANGWLLMALLKMVRDNTTEAERWAKIWIAAGSVRSSAGT